MPQRIGVKHFEYQIVVQWDARRSMYEAYSPTMSMFAAKFLPDAERTVHNHFMEKAVWYAESQVKGLLTQVKALGIIPPPPDIGPTDPTDYASSEDDLGEMVL